MSTNRFDQLIDQWEPKLQRAFLDSIYALRDAAHVDQIAQGGSYGPAWAVNKCTVNGQAVTY